MSLKKFLIYFLIIIIVSSSIFWAIDQFIFNRTFLIPYFWLVYGFMAFITLIAYFASNLGLKSGGEFQSQILLVAIVFRLLFTLVFLLIYTQRVRFNSLNFIIEFFSVYLLFTIFEIYCLLRNLRHQIRK